MANEGTKEKLDIELEAPADFTSPEVLYQDLINTIRKYHPSDDITMIEKAYRIADEAHKEQKRKSGEPYIIHPLCVAIILADLEMDKETIAAGLLHDVVEDTIMTLEQLTKEFGTEVVLPGGRRHQADTVELGLRTRWRSRQTTCAKCSWPWQRTSALSSSSWRTGCTT